MSLECSELTSRTPHTPPAAPGASLRVLLRVATAGPRELAASSHMRSKSKTGQIGINRGLWRGTVVAE